MGIVVGFHKRPESVNGMSERILPSMVIPGFRLFVAYGLAPYNERSYVAEILIRSSPRVQCTSVGPVEMITYRSVRDGKVSGFEGEMSLRDCGIIQNTYNMHCAFLTREAADAYLRRIEAEQFTHFEKRKWDKLNERRSITIKGTKGKK
jgi:hypothetical protein